MKEKLKRLLKHLVPTGSVVERTMKSGVWVSLTNISGRLLQVLMMIVLARLLSPSDFGLLGIALLSMSATKRFTDIGVNAALIRKAEDNIDSHLNTTWVLEILRGVLILAVLFTVAPYIAEFFDEPAATNLIRAIGFVPIISGFRNPAIVYFQKDLAFHKDFLYHSGGAVAQFIVGVSYALYSPTVWALVFASLSRPLVKTLVSYGLHDYRPWPEIDTEVARELISFGKWMTGSSIMYWVAREGDDTFVGWFLSATALGYYQYAYRLADMPATEMSQTISKVVFPAYSEVQENLSDLQSALLQTNRFVSFLAFPMSFGIVLISPSFVTVVLGSEWTPMIVPMQFLALFGLCHAITGIFGEVWKTLDRPDYIFKTTTLRIILWGMLIWPATDRYGIAGTAFVITLVYVLPILPLDIYLTANLTELRSMELYQDYVYPFVASITMFGTLWYARTVIDVIPIVELVLLVPAGAAIYFAVALLLARQFNWGIQNNLEMIYNGIRG